MASQIPATSPTPPTTMIIRSKDPLVFNSSRQFPWEANVEIIAPKVYISQEAVLSTQPGRTLSFTCSEGFACLGKMQAAKTKIEAFEVFMGRSPYLKRKIHRLSKEEGKQQFAEASTTQKILVLTLPTNLYFSRSAVFETQFQAFHSNTQWATLSLFPEERLPLFRQIIDQVTLDAIQRKRDLEASVDCGSAARHLFKRRK